ncbi:MAG: hypothetical protein ACLFR0_01200 [Alphaproteobacteria bacterium]
MPSRSFFSAVLFLCLGLTLGACENLYLNPSAMPTGYTYHTQKYKTIPSPEAEPIGYEYSEEKNAAILRSFREKIGQMLSQIEERNEILRSLRVVYVYSPVDIDPQSAVLDHVLREELRAKNYILTSDPAEGLILGYMIKEPEQTEKFVNFGDLNKDHRDPPHYHRLQEYEPMIVEMALYEGADIIDMLSAVYNVPMYGYERDYTFKDLTPANDAHWKLHNQN